MNKTEIAVADRRDRIVTLLMSKPLGAADIASAMKISGTTAARDILDLHSSGRIHVSDWRFNATGMPAPLYLAGYFADAERKKVRTPEEADDAPRKIIRKRAGNCEHTPRHWMDVALFGEYRSAP